DPFTDPTSTTTSLDQARDTLRTVVGVANYDLGHVLLVGDTGGLAYGGVVCDSSGNANKGGGASGVTLPLGSAYGSSRLMHETAHQFGVSHTFNDGETNGCASNRSQTTSYESGSGLSIMGYPHICLKINSTSTNGRVVFFHDGSLTQAVNYIAGRGGTCPTTALTGNTPPTVSGGPDRTIPKNTPFTLTATGSDADVNDAAALSWNWEQIDSGNALYFQTSNPASWYDTGDPADTTRPIFRPFPPSPNPSRTFPSLTYILNNANEPPDQVSGLWTAEHLPKVTRQLNFRVVLRDNRAGGGAFADDHVVLNVDGNSGPFLVTAPNTATSLPAGSMQTVTWNVNNTNLAPVNCANVKISLSTDGGQTFPTVLAASTPNDGSEVITLPALAATTTTARIKVEAVGNIFFDISDANFTITSGVSCPVVTSFAPAAGNTGTSVKIFGTGFTSTTAVKFSNNVTATFTVNNDNQITVTQPAGAASGPITISKAGCADAVTTAYIVCPAAAATLSVDDNGIEQITSPRYAVNRLTPASYPATLQSVSIRIENTQNIQPGFPFTLLYGVNADGDTDINNTSFQTMSATVGTLGTFVRYDLPQPITIQAGDFVVGYTFPNGGQTALLDTTAPQGRSYTSSDGLNFTTSITPNNTQANLFIRAGVLAGCGFGAAACPTVSGISPASGQIGDTVTITGTGFSGVSAVKFNSNVIANFTIVSDTQITAIVPPGTTSGAITISEPGCADALTASFTVNAPACMTVTGFSPASALPGVPIVITGTNFTGASVVKFSTDQAAVFTVNSPTQITAIVPPGAAFGPITISKQGCADVQTASFTPCNTNLALQVDDGTSETSSGFAGPVTAYYVSRLTPAVYPATLTTVQVYMNTTAGPSASTPITVLAAANPSGSSTINGISFQTQSATFGTLGQYNSYTLTNPITINSGDFVIGFSVAIPSGSTWFVEVRDTTSPQGRSYRSTNAGATFTIPTGNPNYLIRGVYQRPCCSGVTVAVSPTGGALPTGTIGTAYSQTFTQTGGVGATTWSVSAGSLPAGLSLNTATGALTGTPTTTGTSSFTIRATDQNNCTGERAYTLAVVCPAITINPSSLPNGAVGAAYSQTLAGASLTGGYTFLVTGGALPPGLSLSSGGVLSGTPNTITGSPFSFTVTATNTASGCTGSQSYTVSIACPTITLTPTTLPGVAVGDAYNQTITASPAGSYSFAVTNGALPTGLTLTGGVLSGTVSATGTFNFTITATGAGGCTGTQSYLVTISSPFCATPPANLTSWWKAEGNPSDVRNTNNGTLQGSVTFAAGKVGQAFSFNGTNGYVGLPDNFFPVPASGTGNTPFTFETWFKTSMGGVILGQQDSNTYTNPTAAYVPGLYVGTNGKLHAEMFWSGSASPITTTASVNDNVFHHVAVVYNGTTETLYLDGNVVGSVTQSQYGFSPAKYQFGTGFTGITGWPNTPGGWYNFNGLIDEPTLYGRALTASEVQNVFNAGSQGKCPTCVAPPANLTSSWKAENNAGDAANANNGTLQGSATFAAGKVGQAFSFNGANGYVQLPDNFFPHPSAGAGSTSFTFETWFKTSGSGIIFGQQIAAPYATPQAGYAPGIYVGTNGKLHVEMFWNGTISPIISAANVNDGVFHHVAVIYNGTTETVYLDGSVAGSAAHTQQSYDSGSYHYQFGTGLADTWPNASSGWFNFNGLIDEPTLYSRALTASEVLSIVNAGSAGKCCAIAIDQTTLPNGSLSTVYSQTLTTSSAVGAVSFSSSGTLPPGLTLSSGGVLSGTPTQSGLFNFTVTATDSAQCSASQAFTVAVNCPTISFSPSLLPVALVGTAYSQTITASPGSYNFAVTAGALPLGVMLTSGGALSGTPTQTGTFTFTVTASNDIGGCQANQVYQLAVNCPLITLGPASLTDGTVGAAYSQTITPTGLTGAYVFSLDDGALPAGLTLSSGGVISGTPTAGGTFTAIVRATHTASGCQGTKALTINVVCPTINITPTTLPSGNVGAAYNQSLTANGGTPAYTFTLASGLLPAGLSLGANGAVTGTPLASGASAFTVAVTDNYGCTGMATISLTINCNVITVTPPAVNAVSIGEPYSQTFTQTGGIGLTAFSTVSVLPAGFTLSAAGVLSGTTVQTGTYPLTVKATDSNGCQGSILFTLTINGCGTVTVNPASLPAASGGAAYSQTLSATPTLGSGSYSFSVTNGVLPGGLTLSSAGVLSGTVSQTGTFSFRVTATSPVGCSGFRDYTLAVTGCTAITVDPATLPGGTVGTAYNQTVSGNPAGAYNYSVTAGALPTGLTLNAATGAVTGTPSQRGTYNFTVTAANGGCSGSRAYSVVIGCPSLTVSSLPSGVVGTAYNSGINVTPTGSYTYSISAGSLPAGLTLNTSTGSITGTPTAAGSSTFTIRITASGGCIYGANYTVAVNCPTITLSALTTPTLNAAYNQTITTTPAGGNYSYAVTTGVLPTGLTLNQLSGAISGTPTVAGTFNFTITATGFGTCTGSRSYSFTIAPGACPTITLASLSGGNVGQLYTASVAASPTGTYSYAVTAGALPPGLTLYAGFGLLNGYPTTEGSFNFTITATDINNCTGQQAYTVVIGGVLRIATTNDFTGDRRSDFALWRADQQQWLIVDGASNATQTLQWGQAGDSAVAGDFDGDGKADPAVFGKDGHWRVKLSGNGTTLDKAWGLGSDTPVPGDYDGDGKTDLAVWRGADTNWYIQRSSDGQIETKPWGSSLAPYSDIPVPGDYDGDGKNDLAVFRQSNGHWYIRQSSDGTVLDKAWGLGTDVPVAADYDGDGKTDIAVWRGSEGVWYIIQSSNGALKSKFWGAAYAPYHDMPITGDYDGDGKTDFAVWRQSDNRWYIVQSTDGATRIVSQGRTGDTPIGGR
ncbi:MAG TPA: putative Ig domain-containing protein, partial [Blastocatellia bacterium]|nr:putative Ig domain-containing protein [Blastocatellia bacterium]